MAFSKMWEVMVRLEWSPEANEVVWAGMGPGLLWEGWRHLLPVTGAIPLLSALSPLCAPAATGPDCLAPSPTFSPRLHQACVSFLLLL